MLDALYQSLATVMTIVIRGWLRHGADLAAKPGEITSRASPQPEKACLVLA